MDVDSIRFQSGAKQSEAIVDDEVRQALKERTGTTRTIEPRRSSSSLVTSAGACLRADRGTIEQDDHRADRAIGTASQSGSGHRQVSITLARRPERRVLATYTALN